MCSRSSLGAVLAWFVPLLIETPPDLVWDARISTFLVTLSLAARFPLGLFYNLLGGQQRFDLQNLGNFVATVLYAVLVALLIPRGGGLVLLGAADAPRHGLRLGLPLIWLRRELPQLQLRRAYVTRERVRDLVGVSWSNFLVHVANKVVFSTDVVVVGIVLGAGGGDALRDRLAKLFRSPSASAARLRPCSSRRLRSTRARASASASGGCCSPGFVAAPRPRSCWRCRCS